MSHKIWVLTMFPQMFEALTSVGVIGQALQGQRGPGIELHLVSISDYSPKGFKGVDSAPYGGGAGMVMRADVLKEALLQGVIKRGGYSNNWREQLTIVCPGPRGPYWCDQMAREKAVSWFQEGRDTVFICGRYEGIDERFIENYVNEHISLGGFVLSGGELATMAFIDSAMRFIPGVLGNDMSSREESYSGHFIEQPQYTRPSLFEEKAIPEALLSGDHKRIESYRKEQRIAMTKKYRPDLLKEDN